MPRFRYAITLTTQDGVVTLTLEADNVAERRRVGRREWHFFAGDAALCTLNVPDTLSMKWDQQSNPQGVAAGGAPVPSDVSPEWIPKTPKDDSGPFQCYILWVRDTRQYYVGHTGNLEDRLSRHFSGSVKTTKGHDLKLLWASEFLGDRRTPARQLEAKLKGWVVNGDVKSFEEYTGLYFAKDVTLLELGRKTGR